MRFRITTLVHGFSLAICVGALNSCDHINPKADKDDLEMVAGLRGSLGPLAPPASGRLTPAQRRYLEYYDFAPAGVHLVGTFESGGLELVGHIVRPREPRRGKGSVIVLHGYFDHSGNTAKLVNHLVAEGYHVAILDLPGHGLSAGSPVSVRDFSTYQKAFCDFFQQVSPQLPTPHDVVAHSMGATIVIDCLAKQGKNPVRRMVFLAPLIKDTKPRFLHALGAAVAPLIPYIPRVPENNSSDVEYKKWVAREPLQCQYVSTRWSVAFNRWRKELDDTKHLPGDPLVIYAETDTVVCNDFSRECLRKIFPGHRSVVIKGGRHQLINDSAPIRERVFRLISEELGRQP